MQNVIIRIALQSQGIGAILAHAGAMAIAIGGKCDFVAVFFDGKVGAAQP